MEILAEALRSTDPMTCSAIITSDALPILRTGPSQIMSSENAAAAAKIVRSALLMHSDSDLTASDPADLVTSGSPNMNLFATGVFEEPIAKFLLDHKKFSIIVETSERTLTVTSLSLAHEEVQGSGSKEHLDVVGDGSRAAVHCAYFVVNAAVKQS